MIGFNRHFRGEPSQPVGRKEASARGQVRPYEGRSNQRPALVLQRGRSLASHARAVNLKWIAGIMEIS